MASGKLQLLRSHASSSNPAKTTALGWVQAAHLGGLNAANTSSYVTSFEGWAGARLGGVMDFGGKDTWAAIEGTDAEWTAVKGFSDQGYVIIRTLAMIPVGTDLTKPDSFTDLRSGALGAYDAHWRNLADRLVNNGLGGRRIVFRLAWEQNGNNEWSPFQVYRTPIDTGNVMGGGAGKSWPNNPTLAAGGSSPTSAQRYGAVQDFVTYWRRIVDTVRDQLAARGANPWTVEWAQNPNLGYASSQQIVSWATYPGRRWCDYAGADTYDTTAGASGGYIASGALVTGAAMTAARQSVWTAKRTGPYGLEWLAGFARREGLKIMIGETSISNQVDTSGSNPTGGQDNPTWWTNLFAWWQANIDVAGILTVYNIAVARENADFRVCEPNSSGAAGVDSTVSPLAAAAYRQLTWPSYHGGRVAAGQPLPKPAASGAVLPTTYPATYPAFY